MCVIFHILKVIIEYKREEVFLMRFENLSDSETGRDTYEKDIEISPKKPIINTTLSQKKAKSPENVLDENTNKNESLT